MLSRASSNTKKPLTFISVYASAFLYYFLVGVFCFFFLIFTSSILPTAFHLFLPLSRNLNMYLLYTKREYTKQVIIKIHKSTLSKYKYYISFDKEGNILFNDALDTFLIRLYGVGRMVWDHSDSKEETHCMGYSFRLAARVLLYASSDRHDSICHGLCYTSRVEHWLEQEIAQCISIFYINILNE